MIKIVEFLDLELPIRDTYYNGIVVDVGIDVYVDGEDEQEDWPDSFRLSNITHVEFKRIEFVDLGVVHNSYVPRDIIERIHEALTDYLELNGVEL